jgi:hypothetical protein
MFDGLPNLRLPEAGRVAADAFARRLVRGLSRPLWLALFPTVEGIVAQVLAAVLVIGLFLVAEHVRIRRPLAASLVWLTEGRRSTVRVSP